MTNYFKKISIAPLFLLCITANVTAQNFSHDDFHKVISQHVTDGIVDYPAINNSIDYHNYITALKEKNKFHSSREELSYWINAYNALAIKGILDDRSPESFFGKVGYFYNAEYKVNGETINLYNLEHDIIIPLGEPRIHFALNCASASCPKLNSTTYQPDKLEQQLEHATISFINDKKLNQFDMKTKTARISKIFDWFEEDFAKYSGSVQNYLALYVTDKNISNALAANAFEIEYLEYDWSLNGIPPDTLHTEKN
ncbi:hypothetical protein MNBD_GAMMA06-1788 [hydrothermal vent metagenome]|uniref:DUF547 domain-containing protein n=1 Tax=hydrothermal vent metagenome TaxID=652676 RepID=A0A3B0W4S1_9ZZZZ